MADLAEALRRFGAGYLAQHTLSTAQARAWRAIAACRTRALGGAQLACDHCGLLVTNHLGLEFHREYPTL